MDTVNPETGEVKSAGIIDMDEPGPVAAKVAKVMGEIEKLPKSGWNDYHNYPYSTDADVAEAVRPLLAKHGLAVFPSTAWTDFSVVETNRGTANRCLMAVDIVLVEGESGGYITTRWYGEAIDNGDKAAYKAYTGALKYWAMKTFQIASEEDPERDGHEQKGGSSQPRNGRSGGGNKYDPLGLEDEMPFGKHKGKTIQWIVDNHLDYMVWLVGEKDDFELTDKARDYANAQVKKAADRKAQKGQQNVEDEATEEPPSAHGDAPPAIQKDQEELPY